MTEKRDMKWALELAIASIENPDANWDRKYLAIAADMLKNGGPVVEKVSKHKLACCPSCGKILRDGYCCITPYNECNKSSFYHYKNDRDLKIFLRKWTVREKIQIVTEKSEPTFEEMK